MNSADALNSNCVKYLYNYWIFLCYILNLFLFIWFYVIYHVIKVDCVGPLASVMWLQARSGVENPGTGTHSGALGGSAVSKGCERLQLPRLAMLEGEGG